MYHICDKIMKKESQQDFSFKLFKKCYFHLKLKKLQKKQRFTVSRKIADSKGVTFEKDIKLNAFLSVFSVLSHMLEE